VCSSDLAYGISGHGGHADYLKVPASTLVPLPDELSFETGAAISCGTGTAYQALRRMNLTGGDTIAVIGQGPVGLSATQLARRTEEGGWTVGQVLGHMAFWDRFLEARWRAAITAGPGAQPTVLPHELADLLNSALPPVWSGLATQPAAIVAETLAAAEAVDAVIAGLPAETPVLEVLAARTALLDRSIHRKEHLAQIERAIG
jgi:hypothetical protein